MGLLDGFKRIKDPVRGSAQIVSSTQAPHGATSGNCRMHLVVSVPGHQSFAVDDSFLIRVKKWPHAGQTLPIEASQSNPRKFKIRWDEIPTWRDTASAQAAQIAAAMNQQPPPGEGGAQYAPYTPQQGATGTPMAMINGRVPADGPGAVDDRIAALERLAALKDSGVLTEAEFETEKARILDS